MAAKVITCAGRYDSSTEALKTLHWLPIHLHIQFKIGTLVFRSLHGIAPKYLCDLIKLESNDRYRLWYREQQNILKVPFTKCKTFADRAFSVAGPKVWNNLPVELRSQTDFGAFKKQLKTHLKF